MIADEHTITDYIPQRPPMVLIGQLISAVDKKTVTSLTIRPETLFTEDGSFTEPGLIENMAQTAAAGAGYRARAQGQAPSPGFIGGIRNLKIHFLPRVGDEILTEATVEHEVMNATVVLAKVKRGSALIAECEFKIFLMNPNPPA
ncbi:MAG TPA: hypothetical protein VMC08_08145 [Bacteroidales bacterium]|nr:hypothetical protein [Bacteroidales bacterium]